MYQNDSPYGGNGGNRGRYSDEPSYSSQSRFSSNEPNPQQQMSQWQQPSSNQNSGGYSDQGARSGPGYADDGQPLAVHMQDANVGKNVKESKKRVTWQFCFENNDTVHSVQLFHSLLSGKRKILMDGRMVFQQDSLSNRAGEFLKSLTAKTSTGLYDHAWQMQKNHLLRVNIVEDAQGYTYDLYIDNQPFSRLRRKDWTQGGTGASSSSTQGKAAIQQPSSKMRYNAATGQYEEVHGDGGTVKQVNFNDFVSRGPSGSDPPRKQSIQTLGGGGALGVSGQTKASNNNYNRSPVNQAAPRMVTTQSSDSFFDDAFKSNDVQKQSTQAAAEFDPFADTTTMPSQSINSPPVQSQQVQRLGQQPSVNQQAQLGQQAQRLGQQQVQSQPSFNVTNPFNAAPTETSSSILEQTTQVVTQQQKQSSGDVLNDVMSLNFDANVSSNPGRLPPAPAVNNNLSNDPFDMSAPMMTSTQNVKSPTIVLTDKAKTKPKDKISAAMSDLVNLNNLGGVKSSSLGQNLMKGASGGLNISRMGPQSMSSPFQQRNIHNMTSPQMNMGMNQMGSPMMMQQQQQQQQSMMGMNQMNMMNMNKPMGMQQGMQQGNMGRQPMGMQQGNMGMQGMQGMNPSLQGNTISQMTTQNMSFAAKGRQNAGPFAQFNQFGKS